MQHANTNEPDRLCFDERFVARFLNISLGTLRRWRHDSCGPRYRKIGNLVRYCLEDVRQWLEQQPAGGATVREAQ